MKKTSVLLLTAACASAAVAALELETFVHPCAARGMWSLEAREYVRASRHPEARLPSSAPRGA